MQIILARLDETDFQFGVLHFLISLFKRKFKNFLQIFFRMIRTISFFGNPLNSFAQYLVHSDVCKMNIKYNSLLVTLMYHPKDFRRHHQMILKTFVEGMTACSIKVQLCFKLR